MQIFSRNVLFNVQIRKTPLNRSNIHRTMINLGILWTCFLWKLNRAKCKHDRRKANGRLEIFMTSINRKIINEKKTCLDRTIGGWAELVGCPQCPVINEDLSMKIDWRSSASLGSSVCHLADDEIILSEFVLRRHSSSLFSDSIRLHLCCIFVNNSGLLLHCRQQKNRVTVLQELPPPSRSAGPCSLSHDFIFCAPDKNINERSYIVISP